MPGVTSALCSLHLRCGGGQSTVSAAPPPPTVDVHRLRCTAMDCAVLFCGAVEHGVNDSILRNNHARLQINQREAQLLFESTEGDLFDDQEFEDDRVPKMRDMEELHRAVQRVENIVLQVMRVPAVHPRARLPAASRIAALGVARFARSSVAALHYDETARDFRHVRCDVAVRSAHRRNIKSINYYKHAQNPSTDILTLQ